jgi:hypothetical protein
MLIAIQTSNALDELYGSFFDLNATLDRVVSVMLNDFSMPQASDIVHHKIAHLTPLLADKISEIKDNYNVSSIRPEVHRDDRNYSDLEVMFKTVLEEFEGVYEMIKMCYDTAHTHGDLNVCADLMKFIPKFSVVIGQIITLRDKAVQMPTGFDTFDRHITSWKIDGLEDYDD